MESIKSNRSKLSTSNNDMKGTVKPTVITVILNQRLRKTQPPRGQSLVTVGLEQQLLLSLVLYIKIWGWESIMNNLGNRNWVLTGNNCFAVPWAQKYYSQKLVICVWALVCGCVWKRFWKNYETYESESLKLWVYTIVLITLNVWLKSMNC